MSNRSGDGESYSKKMMMGIGSRLHGGLYHFFVTTTPYIPFTLHQFRLHHHISTIAKFSSKKIATSSPSIRRCDWISDSTASPINSPTPSPNASLGLYKSLE
ncbi:hypothetical protein L1887_12434 [Cichorium endivia]|nr:hypothetical protein L1887_12434 [Cichorium endivia]